MKNFMLSVFVYLCNIFNKINLNVQSFLDYPSSIYYLQLKQKIK